MSLIGAFDALVAAVVPVALAVVPDVPVAPALPLLWSAVAPAVVSPARADVVLPAAGALLAVVFAAPGALMWAFRSSYVPLLARSRQPVSIMVSVEPVLLAVCSKSAGVVTPSLRAGWFGEACCAESEPASASVDARQSAGNVRVISSVPPR
jgi:hypothetical protein